MMLMVSTMKSTEKFRHECEVRHLLKLRTTNTDAAYLYLTKVQTKRGAASASKLLEDSKRQWKWGSRGDRGIWLFAALIEREEEY